MKAKSLDDLPFASSNCDLDFYHQVNFRALEVCDPPSVVPESCVSMSMCSFLSVAIASSTDR